MLLNVNQSPDFKRIVYGINVTNKSLMDNTLNDFNDLDSNVSHADDSTTLKIHEDIPKSVINTNMKKFFKTYFTFYHTSKKLETENSDIEVAVQCCTSANVNHSKPLETNIVEVLLEPISTNELSVVLPEIQTNKSANKYHEHHKDKPLTRNRKVRKNENTHLNDSDGGMLNKSSISQSPLNMGNHASTMTNTHRIHQSSFNLFPCKFRHEIEKSSSLHSKCRCLRHEDLSCKHHYLHSNLKPKISTENWQNINTQKPFEQSSSQMDVSYLRNQKKINHYSNDIIDWYNIGEERKGSCVFHKQLSKIKENYPNVNNNNRSNNARRTIRSITDTGCTFNNKDSFKNTVTNQLYRNNYTPHGQMKMNNSNWNCKGLEKSTCTKMPCDNDIRNMNANKCGAHSLNSSHNNYNTNQCDVHQRTCHCSRYYEPCIYNSCCNLCPESFADPCSSVPCCNDINQESPCCMGRRMCTYCPNKPTICRTCPPMNGTCCESHAACMDDQPNNISKHSDDSCKTVYCESSGSQDCSDIGDCCCTCPCRCSQFPKPPPYCLNTTYRMNYFQKCIPKFRRYRECDNLRLPLC